MCWIKDNKYTNVYYQTKMFDKYKYNIFITLEETDKSLKYWIAISSGKKRKEFDIFEEKENKSLVGIKPLFWIKNEILEFPKYYTKGMTNKSQYICITWADNRRRNIYQRLEREGFKFMNIGGEKCLVKKI